MTSIPITKVSSIELRSFDNKAAKLNIELSAPKIEIMNTMRHWSLFRELDKMWIN